ncbi:MAG: hypothetical protein KA397_01010 [Paludibacteraceae bacterium]|nr:hypothetical protein [Paludibacteraceae bacterium]MBP6284049.1 hypothetical protein [Paludibacteraceae bacterium]
MTAGKRILICPLNWGLGHATRCIPIIQKLHQEGNTILIASYGISGTLLQEEFPQLQHIYFRGLTMHYSKGNSQIARVILSTPSILYHSIKEHFTLKKLIKEHQIDIIISDNRFGLWHKQVTTAYISHQLLIKMPTGFRFLEKSIWKIHRRIIHHYTYCLIPDYQDTTKSLAGKLTHKYRLPKNAYFCNPLSRFHAQSSIVEENEMYASEVLVILSGLEPQRTVLESLLITQLKELNKRTILIQGVPSKETIIRYEKNITILPYLLHTELQSYIRNTGIVICRAGYSSIMDLVSMQKKAILIPTPGQPEQEYLGKYLAQIGLFAVQQQASLSIQQGIADVKNTYIPNFEKSIKLPF